jgi:hypothetical protein
MTLFKMVRNGARQAVAGWPIFALLCAAGQLAASTIIDTGAGRSGPAVNASQYEEQGWTQTQAYTNVSISVALSSWTPGQTFDVTAYLTEALGPSAASPAFATATISGSTPDTTALIFQLFSGLTLGPGTYFLTLTSDDNDGLQPGAIWPTVCDSRCTSTMDAGVALLNQSFVNQSFGTEDPAFPPGSLFMTSSSPVNLLVTGDLDLDPPSNEPEPSTFAAMLAGVAGLLLLRKRRA